MIAIVLSWVIKKVRSFEKFEKFVEAMEGGVDFSHDVYPSNAVKKSNHLQVVKEPLREGSMKQEESIKEEIEFYGHKGECKHCEGGIVKMGRDRETMELQLDNCFCLACGARYRVAYDGPIHEFERQQWKQKAQAEG